LATHKSAIKRARQNRKRRLRNRMYKTRVKNAIRQVREAVQKNSLEEAQEKLSKAVSIIQKTAGKGIIHKRNAARKVSRLTKLVNSLAISGASS
jgi:small subunit ribosomal protein S20